MINLFAWVVLLLIAMTGCSLAGGSAGTPTAAGAPVVCGYNASAQLGQCIGQCGLSSSMDSVQCSQQCSVTEPNNPGCATICASNQAAIRNGSCIHECNVAYANAPFECR